MTDKKKYPDVPVEKLRFASTDRNIHDLKLETKQIGYFQDAFRRFCKNKSSVVAAIIILILVLYAILAPILGSNAYTRNLSDTMYLSYTKLLPKCPGLEALGWDGCSRQTLSEATYLYYHGIGVETGMDPVVEVYAINTSDKGKVTYDAKVDSYTTNGMMYMTMTESQYKALQAWQNESGVQVIYPAVSIKNVTDANIWYDANKKGAPKLDKEGNFTALYKTSGGDGDYDSLRIEGDPGLDDPESAERYRYAAITGDSSSVSYKVRIFKYAYFQYLYGFEPSFLFGTNDMGQDIFTRLGSGARFSFMLAISVSVLNLLLGAIYGAIEGYYGGTADLLMERFSDILSGVPTMVVTVLFQLHLAKRIGVVPSLLLAFVSTGWIGMASRVRMQFYRFKGQEYILSARTLGASDWRLMFRHIFPNALGTIITGSILIIPGVIFSESSLTYLGIINLESTAMTSVGTMLAGGRQYLNTFPHIILFPCIFISLLEISFNLFGNGLRDAFNPALRGADE
jgi:oligopeptide transport system permease protein